MNHEAERRCPTCGALVSVEAEWCGQCFSSLSSTSAQPERAPGPGAPQGSAPDGALRAEVVTALRARGGDPAWPCPFCRNRNPVELQVCASCGTPFGHGFEEPEPSAPVAPEVALRRSLVFPGLGHRACGRRLDGLARSVLFLWTGGTALVLFLSGRGPGGFGPVAPLFGLYLAAAVAVYVLSAVDAGRLASGRDQLLGPKALLWAVVSLVLLSIVLATATTFQAARSR